MRKERKRERKKKERSESSPKISLEMKKNGKKTTPQGLIMNFFHHFYPSLLKVPGFLLEFVTPIVKATKGTRVRFVFEF